MKTVGFYSIKVIDVEKDCYDEFLGKDYIPPKKFGAVVSNHTTMVDVTIMGALFKPCMVSKSTIKNVPFLGRCFDLVNTIYVDRSDPNSKHTTVD